MKINTQNYLLYGVTSFIWGSTWYAIHMQLEGAVPPMWSIVYRFALAGLILLAYCIASRMNLRFSKRQHFFIALQGLLFFSLNYILYYAASKYLISGINALVFALIVVMNIINCRILFKTPITARVVVASLMGLLGLILVFWSESAQWILQSSNKMGGTAELWLGIALATGGTLFASLGNMTAVYNKNLDIPIVASNALGILYGTFFTLVFAVINGQAPAFDFSWGYIASLLYLSIAGTVVAFGTYVVLINRIGADKGGYVFVTTPIVALLLSTFYEDFHWTVLTVLGVLAVMGGNLLVLKRRDGGSENAVKGAVQSRGPRNFRQAANEELG